MHSAFRFWFWMHGRYGDEDEGGNERGRGGDGGWRHLGRGERREGRKQRNMVHIHHSSILEERGTESEISLSAGTWYLVCDTIRKIGCELEAG